MSDLESTHFPVFSLPPLTGVSNVFFPVPPLADTKFMDVLNTWFRFDKHRLKRSVEQFAKFPKATNYDENYHLIKNSIQINNKREY
jgi:hypothetical protein